MGKRLSERGRPTSVSELWDQVFDNLAGAFWSHKGLSGNCPFCHAESSSSKMKFLVRFEDGQFKSYSCFVCQVSGSGNPGVLRLCRQMGLQMNTFDAGALSGRGGEDIYRPSPGGEGEGGGGDAEPIDWPPSWLRESQETTKKGLEYMERRGILDAARVVETYGISFSDVVEMTIGEDRYLRPYPCMVAPMAGEGDDVLGWTTRRLGEGANPDEPKSIALTGKGWKTQSLFGIREVDPRRPITIVEGVFSALSTPNSVAIGGKSIDMKQIELLAATGAKVFVFALDPEVEKRHFATVMYRLHLEAPGCKVFNVEWKNFGGHHGRDPNDRGWAEMTRIIATTVRDHIVKDGDE